jgi:hypothetical protein
MSRNMMWIVGGLVAFWFLFLRRRTSITGGANLSVATGNNAPPYQGMAPGQLPAGVLPGMSAGYGPAPPPPTIIQQQTGTGSILSGVGQLVGGIGTGVGGILSGLGSAGLIGGGGGSYGNGGGYLDGGVFGGADASSSLAEV